MNAKEEKKEEDKFCRVRREKASFGTLLRKNNAKTLQWECV